MGGLYEPLVACRTRITSFTYKKVVIKAGRPIRMVAPIVCSMAMPLNRRRQKSGPTSIDDCRTTVVMDISQTVMIVAVTRLGVSTAYLQVQ